MILIFLPYIVNKKKFYNRDEIDRMFKTRIDAREQIFDVYDEKGFQMLSRLWARSALHFAINKKVQWLGIQTQQLPTDLLMIQELIWKIKPKIIIESGTARGGTAVFFASILELLECGKVLSIDTAACQIQASPVNHRITLIRGDSNNQKTLQSVKSMISSSDEVMAVFDSDHHYSHVRQELENYASLISPGSYMIACDAIFESAYDSPRLKKHFKNWNFMDDNPARAIRDFLKSHPEFEIDPYYNRLGITFWQNGFLRKK